jgi:DNA-binding transcriptional LysR family regulator
MRGSDFAELAAFASVVEHGSFSRAAAHLRLAPSSLSQIVKRLEARLGVELLHRTTRKVSMTGAGVRLFERFRPAMHEMEAAVVDLHTQATSPVGLVRLHLPRAAYAALIEDRLAEFDRTYPDIQLDITVDDALIDIVGEGVDLDIRPFGTAPESLTCLPLESARRHVAVASPTYLAEHGTPTCPGDLARHRCIQWRRPGTEHVYRWVFHIDGCSTLVDVNGPLTVSHCDIAVTAALQSVGVAFVLEQHATDAIVDGRLISLLTAFLPLLPGWSLCYPNSARIAAATQAVIAFLSGDLSSPRTAQR